MAVNLKFVKPVVHVLTTVVIAALCAVCRSPNHRQTHDPRTSHVDLVQMGVAVKVASGINTGACQRVANMGLPSHSGFRVERARLVRYGFMRCIVISTLRAFNPGLYFLRTTHSWRMSYDPRPGTFTGVYCSTPYLVSRFWTRAHPWNRGSLW